MAMGEKLLSLHMKAKEEESKRKTLVENLSREFYSHSYPVSRKERVTWDCPSKKMHCWRG